MDHMKYFVEKKNTMLYMCHKGQSETPIAIVSYELSVTSVVSEMGSGRLGRLAILSDGTRAPLQ